MGIVEPSERKLRSDVVRNRASILEAAQRHFLAHGVSASLEAVAKEAGVGAGTLYRHFPTREALLAGVLQLHSEELVARREQIAQVADPDEALRQWTRALEDYFSAFSGLPEPLMAAAREHEPGNPLTLPCDHLIATTGEFLEAAQLHGHARPSLKGYDLFLLAGSVAWIRGTGAADNATLDAMHTILETGYNHGSKQQIERDG
ncbi:TetR/AcrR family transcriptional regulator [Arthrobacter sedimenti]|uniref:TetR/AcrR family transcriptional regulator n=1 Tax=Arthrobacter sedimenti TaxID=2694931 RepID=UPI000B350ED2|nr:TetR/AcrR family transcriptional regulator [Arthrobacter sedimenti]OUM45649.1 TetR family transcriptional regulator [Arthrobacter agilis]